MENNQNEIEYSECIYCGADVTGFEEVPAVDDDAAWASLAEKHETACEWIETRAHRLEVK